MEVIHILETNYMFNFIVAGWKIFAEFKSIVDWVIGDIRQSKLTQYYNNVNQRHFIWEFIL